MKFLILALLSQSQGFTYEADEILFFPGKEGKIQATGNIRITDGKTTILGDTAFLFRSGSLDSGKVYPWVEIRGESINIKAKSVRYYFPTLEAFFQRDVEVNHQTRTIQADRVYYNGRKDTAWARGNMTIIDHHNNLYIKGKNGFYNFKKKRGKVLGIEEIKIFGETETLNLYSDFISIRRDTLDLIGNVKIIGENESAKGETLIYHQSQDYAYLKGSPEFEYQDGETKGKYIWLKFKDKRLDSAGVFNQAELTFLTEENERLILVSDTIFVNFIEKGEVQSLKALSNPSGFLLLKPSRKKK